jgi:hypothetical protein
MKRRLFCPNGKICHFFLQNCKKMAQCGPMDIFGIPGQPPPSGVRASQFASGVGTTMLYLAAGLVICAPVLILAASAALPVAIGLAIGGLLLGIIGFIISKRLVPHLIAKGEAAERKKEVGNFTECSPLPEDADILKECGKKKEVSSIINWLHEGMAGKDDKKCMAALNNIKSLEEGDKRFVFNYQYDDSNHTPFPVAAMLYGSPDAQEMIMHHVSESSDEDIVNVVTRQDAQKRDFLLASMAYGTPPVQKGAMKIWSRLPPDMQKEILARRTKSNGASFAMYAFRYCSNEERLEILDTLLIGSANADVSKRILEQYSSSGATLATIAKAFGSAAVKEKMKEVYGKLDLKLLFSM